MIPVGMVCSIFSWNIFNQVYYPIADDIVNPVGKIGPWVGSNAINPFTTTEQAGLLYLTYLGLTYVVAVYFIRKWSKKWNESVKA